ncbi:MAG: hypothetical protein KJ955_04310 [Nanoarchaeota archaeon]|nr:hypothetical protein [Nanoarchaeota archaeon]
MDKSVRIILLGDAKEVYNKLVIAVENQAKQGKTNTQEIQLLKSINQKKEFIRQDPFYGDNILKKQIPSSYNANNLWRVELCNFWRMLYTIKGDKIDIICFILDIMNHKDYDKKFKYNPTLALI